MIAEFILPAALLLAAALGLYAAWRLHPAPARAAPRAVRPAGPVPRLHGPRGGMALDQLCARASAAMAGQVAIFTFERAQLRALAGAPRRPRLDVLDQVAAEWALNHCCPSGRGTGVMAASEWQFQPISRGGSLLGLLAIAGRRGREPVTPEQQWLLEDVLREAGAGLARIGAPPVIILNALPCASD